jgi:hypothetical protein
MTPNQTDNTIETGLQRIRRLRFLMWGVLLAFFPLGFLATALRPPEWLLTTIGVVWFVSFVILVLAHGFSRCPACDRFFNVRADLHGNPLTRKCLNCGLSLRCKAC